MASTSPTKLLITLARAAGKAASAKLRGVGMASEAADWTVRAEICERCPLQVVKCGKSYCGQPLLRKIVRDPVIDGCGCPTRAKAKDPTEHCPITPRHEPANVAGGPGVAGVIGCTCKWCHAARPQILPAAA